MNSHWKISASIIKCVAFLFRSRLHTLLCCEHGKKKYHIFSGSTFVNLLKDRFNCFLTGINVCFSFQVIMWNFNETSFGSVLLNLFLVFFFHSHYYFYYYDLNSIGASIVGRLGSWLGTISISLQGALGMVYIGEILLKSVPFNQCVVSDFCFRIYIFHWHFVYMILFFHSFCRQSMIVFDRIDKCL